MIQLYLPADLSPRAQNARIDWAGAAWISAAISALLLIVEWGGDTYAWTSSIILGLIALCIASFIIFGFVEMRAPEPLLPLDLFKRQTILIVNIISLLAGFVLFALVYYTPLLMQGGLGLSPAAAGAYQTPLAVSTALGSLLCTQIFAFNQRMKALMIAGGFFMVAGGAFLLNVDADTNLIWLASVLAVAGFGAGFVMPMLTLLVQSIVARERMGVATSTVQFLRLIGSTIGTAIVAAAVNSVFATSMQAAFTPTTDPQLMKAFHNPQAIVDPSAQAQLQQLLSQLGAEAAQQAQYLIEVAHGALIDGVRLGYVMSFVLSVMILGLILFMRTPNYRSAENRIEISKTEGVMDIL
jgi:hypothetical protein